GRVAAGLWRVAVVADPATTTTTAAATTAATAARAEVVLEELHGPADIVGAGHQAARVGLGDRVVAGVGVTVEFLRAGGFQDGIQADEPAGDGVVLAGPDVGQAGVGVGGLVEETVVVEPGDGGAAGPAERGEL